LLLGTVLVVLIIGIVAYLKYQNFTFIWTMKMKSLLLMKEFLKNKTIIQLNRIQQVNINQSQKISRVYELDVDTAGSAKKKGK
jgi:putative membrane protein